MGADGVGVRRASENTVGAPNAREALAAVATAPVDVGASSVSCNPLEWPGYPDQLRVAQTRLGETESAVIAEGTVGGRRVTLVAFDFDFLGGSMGEATGERIVHAFAHAIARRHPLISLVATGGARMQEGMRSLVQMQRIAQSVADARRAGIPHISVIRNPTTGGVWVSLASTADVIIGIEGASASFAGARVRGTAGVPSDDFLTSGKKAAGFIDVLVAKEALPATLDRYVSLLGDSQRHPTAPPVPDALSTSQQPATGWAAVRRARARERPRAVAYLDAYFSERVEISGDRVGGIDPEMLCGLGRRGGTTIAYAAQTGRHNNAAGFRMASRLLRLADRLSLPVLTLIDTPGAKHDEVAEQTGIGTAIGETFIALTEVSGRITSLVIGEGGSGGALALATPDNLWATPDSYFSVIGPESAASILYRDSGRAAEAADRLRLGPKDLLALGVIAGIARPVTHQPLVANR
jgi:acyl-CoA carboxylase subunit beta